MRPASTAITKRSTRTSPVSMSTVTSANWAAKGGGETGETYEATAMIWRWSRWCREERATSSRVTLRPSGAQARRSARRISAGETGAPRSLSSAAATSLICSATCSAARTAAAPEIYVVEDAYAPLSKGVKSVSEE